MSTNTLGFARQSLVWALIAGLFVACGLLVFRVYSNGNTSWAIGLFVLFASAFYIYLSNANIAYRYLFPGVAGMLIFIAFPLLYTVQIGFTNYSSSNLLTQERSRAYLLDQSIPDEARMMRFTLHGTGKDTRIALAPSAEVDGKAFDRSRVQFVSAAVSLKSAEPQTVAMQAVAADAELGEAQGLSSHIAARQALQNLKLTLPDGAQLRYVGVRDFGPINPVWKPNADGSLTQLETGEAYSANTTTGFFENIKSERVQPGFIVGVGLGNYARMFNDPDFRGPFLSIFAWTMIFATLTVIFCLAIGATLAVLLNWEGLEYRTVYRTLLFLPYAVPGFISILVFKGLFNQNFGEINAILSTVFGVKPAWFADPFLAKVMLLTVNTWLGYPYIMVLCSGLIKSIPADLYEASAIAGAGPLTNFFKITLPLLIKPLTPLLISVFAFNFNNFVLIALLTDGRPDFLNTKLPAGTNDILVSYTYRIAFQDSGQNFGLAAAISTVLFFMVALLSLANLRLSRASQDTK